MKTKTEKTVTFLHQLKLLQTLVSSMKSTGSHFFPSELEQLDEVVGSMAAPDNCVEHYTRRANEDGETVDFVEDLHVFDKKNVVTAPWSVSYNGPGTKNCEPQLVSFTTPRRNERWVCVRVNQSDDVGALDETFQNYYPDEPEKEFPTDTESTLKHLGVVLQDVLGWMPYEIETDIKK